MPPASETYCLHRTSPVVGGIYSDEVVHSDTLSFKGESLPPKTALDGSRWYGGFMADHSLVKAHPTTERCVSVWGGRCRPCDLRHSGGQP